MAYAPLVEGGFCSTDPDDLSVPVSIRMNNPGALNESAWEKEYPGHVASVETTSGNRSVLFEAPEYGVAAWWELLRRYREAGATTVSEIVNRYGGGQDYARYCSSVEGWSGLPAAREIKLDGDDGALLAFARAMFRYEAGRESPLLDGQIMRGFEIGREVAAGKFKPAPPSSNPALGGVNLRRGMAGDRIRVLQTALHAAGFHDLMVDGDYGPATEHAVRAFQMRRNLDPDGVVGKLTWAQLSLPDAAQELPPLTAPPRKVGGKPLWYAEAEKWVGWHEIGNNRGIDEFCRVGRSGSPGDPYCAIFVNYCLEKMMFPGTRSAAARSFESHPEFIRLGKPSLGAIVTMWRGSPNSGQGHVFMYDGENSAGIRGIGANESDTIKRSIHSRSRITGYWWPKDVQPISDGAITISEKAGAPTGKET